MANEDELDILRAARAPAADPAARARAVAAARTAFEQEKISPSTQGTVRGLRHTSQKTSFWRRMMHRRFYATPALATLLVLPLAGYATWQFMQTSPLAITSERGEASVRTQDASSPVPPAEPAAVEREVQVVPSVAAPSTEAVEQMRGVAIDGLQAGGATRNQGMVGAPAGKMAGAPAPSPDFYAVEESRDRFQNFDTNPIRLALESPVSTFSIDVDTASYSFVRRMLQAGFLPDANAVRVEELINYFPYDWNGPETADVPFQSNVTVLPTPWNEGTKLMHIAIQGYDMQPAQRPAANLVFLIDVSGSMNAPDKLPLLKSAFRMLVDQMSDQDTVSIVTYAGNAGTVLEPTKGSDKRKILDAIDGLQPGGTTAGEAGIREAYRLAESSFVKDGINRVMLATDGDFNVGTTDDDALKKLVEQKRDSGVFLSVFGFGRGNLNDQLMQTLAQNGNGTAAYIDTLAEAEKVLVQEAGSTLFPIAKDVKIQVEFNPDMIAEYRLIGYETRALKREDFNNDRVDAGEIGSGHSVTAIYEITPKGSDAAMVDELRYGQPNQQAGGADTGEYAFVKIRYKMPNEDVSKLIETPVTAANEVSSFASADAELRFSVAVAAFGQKLRGTDQVAGFGWDRITEIATAARGSDPFGYRSEFLTLVRLASALESGKR